jgi:hypothetical protein
VVLTFYYRDENGFQRVIGETNVGPLAPGESEDATVRWTPVSEGRYHVIAYVDVDDDVDEEDEGNNDLEREVEVTGDDGGGLPGPGTLLALVSLAVAALLVSTFRRRRGD